MSVFEQNFLIGFRDVDSNLEITNKTILGMFEDTGAFHSDSIGCGFKNIEETGLSWIIMHWKVKVLRRPKYGEKISIKTWVAAMKKLYMYRQYEICDESGEVIVIANSKWIITRLGEGAVKVPEWVSDGYGFYERTVFDDWKIDKLKEPESCYKSFFYTVPQSAIDINGHMNNLVYLDVAADGKVYDEFQIMYKKESTLGETLKCKLYNCDDGSSCVIKTEDERHIHAIVKYK